MTVQTCPYPPTRTRREAARSAPWFPEPRFHGHDGLRLAYYEAGPEDGAPLMLLHGWPELAYSWAPLLPALAGAGYRCILPELRGFGASDAPIADSIGGTDHYAIAQMVGDVEALLDHLELPTVTLVGHDWGGIIAWQAARMLGDPAVSDWGRIARIVSICTPMVRQAPVDPLEIFAKRFGADHYFCVFNREPERVAALFESDPDALFRFLMRTTSADYAPADRAPAASASPTSSSRNSASGTVKPESEFAHIPKRFAAFLDRGAPALKGEVLDANQRAIYADGFRRSGFHGGIALYRNTSDNWRLTQGLSERATQPSLLISPERDLALPPWSGAHMADYIEDFTQTVIPDCGHWAMWDAPDAVADAMLKWLQP